MTEPLNFEGWICPLPLRDQPNIIIGHGGGGKLSQELIEHLFYPAFANELLEARGDSAVLALPGERVAFTTDSFVVRPLFFPGGSIGDLAVNGTVNDLAMMGARPLYLSAGFILEEGLPIATLGGLVERMGLAARSANVRIVAGDTKVVERGHGDGVYINTSGIGVIPVGVDIGPDKARPGDMVLVSGTLADHGMAILSVREGLEFETVIQSDCAPLIDLVDALRAAAPGVHALRDATRGGAAAALNEIARASGVGVVIQERQVPVNLATAAACELLGMDPLHVANEGKLIAFVPRDQADAALTAMRAHPLGAQAAIIGEAIEAHPGVLVGRTGIGGRRVIDVPVGEQLPRIC
ncbi:MAG: hydrogenase expression/formation protein HypE [Anaerolineae bacterium]